MFFHPLALLRPQYPRWQHPARRQCPQRAAYLARLNDGRSLGIQTAWLRAFRVHVVPVWKGRINPPRSLMPITSWDWSPLRRNGDRTQLLFQEETYPRCERNQSDCLVQPPGSAGSCQTPSANEGSRHRTSLLRTASGERRKSRGRPDRVYEHAGSASGANSAKDATASSVVVSSHADGL